ncbi:hypothetical protein AJ80_09847 [Polytolypa hystricis UAMH7299]|uniref:Uncharacterized protein n=1 Tax=Polytolypa hystricis (strain UAMH7299) TaxID=1447883 RepID=A0A2B7WIB5_POLH7|nr:hypothetical protein AJ80_09847 [Polytolypa hystricis UAMH7299]
MAEFGPKPLIGPSPVARGLWLDGMLVGGVIIKYLSSIQIHNASPNMLNRSSQSHLPAAMDFNLGNKGFDVPPVRHCSSPFNARQCGKSSGNDSTAVLSVYMDSYPFSTHHEELCKPTYRNLISTPARVLIFSSLDKDYKEEANSMDRHSSEFDGSGLSTPCFP